MLRQSGGSRRMTFVPLTPVKTFCSCNRRLRSSLMGCSNSMPIIRPQQAAAQFLDGLLELHAYHQATAAHFLYLRQLLQFVQQVGADSLCILNETLAFDNVQHRQGRRAGQVVAAKRSAQLPIHGLELGADEHGTHGEAVADALGHGNHVRTDAGILVGEKLAATAVSALYLVKDEDGARCRALLPQCLHESRVGHLDAAHALDALE